MGGLLLMIRLLLVLFALVGFLIFSYPFLVAQVSLGKKDPQAQGRRIVFMVTVDQNFKVVGFVPILIGGFPVLVFPILLVNFRHSEIHRLVL